MQDQWLPFLPAQWGRSETSPAFHCRRSQGFCSGMEMKGTGMAEAAEVGGAFQSILSEAHRWRDRGLWWKGLSFQRAGRQVGDAS